MGEGEAVPNYVLKIHQVKSNLKNWNFYEWVIFWVVIPALLLIIYSLPQSIKDEYFILDTSYLWRVQTFLSSSYTHSQLYPHLIGNIAFYFVVLAMIFAFEHNRHRFWVLAGWSLVLVPFISSFLTVLFWGLIGRNTTGQGFSAIVGAFLAYAMFIFVVWGIGDILEVFDHPEEFTGSKRRFDFLKILLGILLALIVIMGIQFGVFIDTGRSTVNGIAHFGGFITSLILLLIFDVRTEKRKYFHQLLGASILFGIFWYIVYLTILMHFVKGG